MSETLKNLIVFVALPACFMLMVWALIVQEGRINELDQRCRNAGGTLVLVRTSAVCIDVAVVIPL